MAIDMDDIHRINVRIDDIKNWVNRRFEETEERRKSAQLRMVAAALTVAIWMMVFYMLGRASGVSHPGVACESEHPTTGASPP
jgi:hypothetical protein